MRLPGAIRAGTVVEAPFSLVDLLPTSASLCGVPAPPEVQGRDYAPLLTGRRAAPPRDSALVQWFGNVRYSAAGRPQYQYRAIRPADYTYAVGEAEWDCLLLDNRADPLQLRNLFGSPEHRDVQAELHACLCREVLAAGEPLPDFVLKAAAD